MATIYEQIAAAFGQRDSLSTLKHSAASEAELDTPPN